MFMGFYEEAVRHLSDLVQGVLASLRPYAWVADET